MNADEAKRITEEAKLVQKQAQLDRDKVEFENILAEIKASAEAGFYMLVYTKEMSVENSRKLCSPPFNYSVETYSRSFGGQEYKTRISWR